MSDESPIYSSEEEEEQELEFESSDDAEEEEETPIEEERNHKSYGKLAFFERPSNDVITRCDNDIQHYNNKPTKYLIHTFIGATIEYLNKGGYRPLGSKQPIAEKPEDILRLLRNDAIEMIYNGLCPIRVLDPNSKDATPRRITDYDQNLVRKIIADIVSVTDNPY